MISDGSSDGSNGIKQLADDDDDAKAPPHSRREKEVIPPSVKGR